MFALLPLIMRGRTELRQDEALVEYIPKSMTEPLNLGEIFPRSAPIEIDLGCGDGFYLEKVAENFNEVDLFATDYNPIRLGRIQKRLPNISTQLIGNSYRPSVIL